MIKIKDYEAGKKLNLEPNPSAGVQGGPRCDRCFAPVVDDEMQGCTRERCWTHDVSNGSE
jgi:hypothetical protein